MTKKVNESGQETVYLGNFERAVGAIAFALICFIGWVIWTDHEALGQLRSNNAESLRASDAKADEAKKVADKALADAEANRKELSDKLTKIQVDLAELKGIVYQHREEQH